MFGLLDFAIDGGFDEFEWDKSVVGFVGEIAEYSDLVCGRSFAVLLPDLIGPNWGCESGYIRCLVVVIGEFCGVSFAVRRLVSFEVREFRRLRCG